jgi:hypothetical protein
VTQRHAALGQRQTGQTTQLGIGSLVELCGQVRLRGIAMSQAGAGEREEDAALGGIRRFLKRRQSGGVLALVEGGNALRERIFLALRRKDG